jgi:hypothetical protein
MGNPIYEPRATADENAKQDAQASAEASSGSDTASYLEKQTRTRRLFSQSQLIVFSFMYMITRVGMGK